MSSDITVIVKGPANTGKGVISLIIAKALQDHGVNAHYQNEDGCSESQLAEVYEHRTEILKTVNPQVIIVEEQVARHLKVA